MVKKGQTLAERLADLSNPEPVFNDPEDDINTETSAKLVDEDSEDESNNGIHERSKLRAKNASFLDDEDQRYLGKKTTRKDLKQERGDIDEDEHALAELGHMFDGLEGDEDDGSDEDEEMLDGLEGDEDDGSDEDEVEDEGDHEDDVEENNKLENGNSFTFEDDGDFSKYGDYDEDDKDSGSENGEDDDEEAESNDNQSGSEVEDEGIQKFSSKNISEEIEKGKAVKQQIEVCDKLLENRILVQKVFSKVNRFPQHENWSKFTEKGDDDYKAKLKESQRSVKVLLDKMLELDSLLASRNQEDIEPPKKKMKLKDYSEKLSGHHSEAESIRNETIQKWNDRTKVAAGNVNSKSFSSFETSTLKQVEQIMANKTRLIERTQLKRSSYEIFGKSDAIGDGETKEKDVEIFDDDDFYHQLLRELIEKKTANSGADPNQLGRQWLEIQKLRTRLKKKVDTKATKGRKVRYDIHSKLVNFMAPIYTQSMNDDAINELFSSLFGNRQTK